MKIYGKIYGLGLEIGLQKVVLDSRDSVALETWDYEDVRQDIRLWFGTWFEKKIVLENWFEIWFEKDIRTDIRLRFATDVRIDIRADVRTDIRIDIRADARTDMRTALEHAPLLSRGLRGNQDGVAVGRWHTAAVAYCRLRAPAADQRLKKISSHGHRSQARGLTPAGTQTPSTEQR